MDAIHLPTDPWRVDAKFRALVEAVPDPVLVVDKEGRILVANAHAERLFGYPREELVGQPVELLVPERLRGVHVEYRSSYVKNAHSRLMGAPLELVARRKDGSEVPVDIGLIPLETEEGLAVIAAVREMTEQKRLETQLSERNQELIETTSLLNNVLQSSTEYAIVATDLDARVLIWNEGARRIYGHTAEEMIGRQVIHVLQAPEDPQPRNLEQFLENVHAAGKAEGVFLRVRKNGERFPASVSVTLRRDAAGRPVGYLTISKDITAQKMLEEQLRRKSEELQEQYARVREANRLKTEFLANMSHELRTPLNSVIGFTEVMYDGKAGSVSEEQKEYLSDVLTSARHLLRLINDVLDLAKVESGKMEFRPEPVDLGLLVTEVRDILRSQAAARRVRMELEIDHGLGPVTVDPSRVKEILYNYLSNAVKFTPREGRVTVRAAAEGSDSFRIEVEDTGSGIRSEDLPRLFVEFQRLGAEFAGAQQGTGLGLALTKRIAEAMGGRVGVRSTPGRGSTFFAILPRVAQPVPKAQPVSEPLPSATVRASAPTILVVEDDAEDRAWLVETLTAAGYNVETAAAGADALARCRQRSFDAVTLDLLLPDMLGWGLLRAIREEGPNRNVPAIVVTVVPERTAGIGFHIHNFLTKPVQKRELLASLKRVGVRPQSAGTVLVVDDDPAVLRLMETVLRQQGYRPVLVPGGQQALEAAAESPPAAVILDILMPGMDGFEFLARFRQTPAGRRTPVIVLTAKELTAEERASLQASAQAVVAKEHGTGTLLQVLRALVPVLPEPTGPATAPANRSSSHRRKASGSRKHVPS